MDRRAQRQPDKVFNVGEVLVWVHVDEKTGQRVQEFVRVRNRRRFTNRFYYQITSQATGDNYNAWGDELYRFEKR